MSRQSKPWCLDNPGQCLDTVRSLSRHSQAGSGRVAGVSRVDNRQTGAPPASADPRSGPESGQDVDMSISRFVVLVWCWTLRSSMPALPCLPLPLSCAGPSGLACGYAHGVAHARAGCDVGHKGEGNTQGVTPVGRGVGQHGAARYGAHGGSHARTFSTTEHGMALGQILATRYPPRFAVAECGLGHSDYGNRT